MWNCLRFVLIGTVGLALSLRADPASPITPRQEFLAEQIAILEEEGRAGTVLPARPLDQIVQLELLNGNLQFKLLADDVADEATIPLKGLRGVCQVQRLADRTSIPGAIRLSIRTLDVEDAKAIGIDLVNIGNMQLDVVVNTPEVAMTTQLMMPRKTPLLEEGNKPRFHIQIVNAEGEGSSPSITRSASSASRLIDENHEQLVQALGEALRLLKAMHLLSGMNEREVKQMLAANTPPDAEVQQKVDAAIRTMHEDPEAGERDLRELLRSRGLPAASVLKHVARDGWSADMTLRIDNLLALVLTQQSDAAEKVNNQPRRLIDLLYWPDPSIRQESADRLRHLSPTSFSFDSTKDPYSQADEIEVLREQLSK